MKRNYTAEVCESIFAHQNERDADVVRAGRSLSGSHASHGANKLSPPIGFDPGYQGGGAAQEARRQQFMTHDEAGQFVTGWFSRPHIADYMETLSRDECAMFNQGKDCSLAIIATWLSEGGDLDPLSLRALDAALSRAVGFTVDGLPLDEVESA
jgi:hypothetical protein